MIIRDTDSKTLREALAILKNQLAGLGPNVQTRRALCIKIMAIEMTLAERIAMIPTPEEMDKVS